MAVQGLSGLCPDASSVEAFRRDVASENAVERIVLRVLGGWGVRWRCKENQAKKQSSWLQENKNKKGISDMPQTLTCE